MVHKIEVVWNDEVVGWVDGLSCDNFNAFGRWIPRFGSATDEFLTRLRKGEELTILVGRNRLRAFLDEEPIDEIEFKILPQ